MSFASSRTGTYRIGIRIMPAALALLLSISAVRPARAAHLHQLHYNNAWVDTDLTTLTGGGTLSDDGAIAAVYTTPNYQLHVYYVDVFTQHVHQSYFNGSKWIDEDLTAETTGLRASPFGIAAFAIGNFQYVYYVDLDAQDVHQLSYNNSTWTDQNLRLLAGSVHAGLGPILAFATTPNNQFHVYYQDSSANSDLHQLYFNGTSWSDSDLTALTGALCYTSWLTGFAIQNQQHVFCPGYTGSSGLDMLHIFYNNSNWVSEDVSQKSSLSIPLYLGGFVSSFFVPNQTKTAALFEVYGVTADAHIRQFTRNADGWNNVDLTQLFDAPPEAGYGASVAFRTTPNNQFHIYYAPTTEVIQLYFNGSSWSHQDLTSGNGNASNNAGLAGFSLGNQQFVYYISQ